MTVASTPGDDVCVFHNKPNSQKQLSKARLLKWYHNLLMKGFNCGVFSSDCDMTNVGMDEIPYFLVDEESRDKNIDKATYFRIELCQHHVIQETQYAELWSIFDCPIGFEAVCKRYNLSFSTLESAKKATGWIIYCLEKGILE